MIRFILCSIIAFTYAQVSCQNFIEKNLGDLTGTNSASRSANFLDINGDGWDDIFISNGKSGGQDNMLYINNQDGTFDTNLSDDMVKDGGSSDGASFADVDNDGDLDMFVVTWHGQVNSFYRGDASGEYTLEPNIAMGNTGTYSEAAAWGDADGDGWLDLCMTNSGGTNITNVNLYYKNNCDDSFSQPSSLLSATSETRASRSVDWIDIDTDGDLDVFITNDFSSKNYLYINDGTGSFSRNSTSTIVQDRRTSAGSSWSDVDNDGDFDLFITNWDGTAGNDSRNQLFINNGNLDFTPVITGSIVDDLGCSFASTFGDYDNDGDEDLFVANAYCNPKNNFLYENVNGVFVKNETSILTTSTGYTFGAAWGDYNNDGFLDIVWANTLNELQTNDFFENQGNANGWFKILLEGTTTNKSAIGSIVRVKANINGMDTWQMRRITSTSGYCSQNSYTQHFGLGDATVIDSLVIEWFGGNKEVHTNLDIRKTCKSVQGEGIICSVTSNTINHSTYDVIDFIQTGYDNEYIFRSKEVSNNIKNLTLYDVKGHVLRFEENIDQVEFTLYLDEFSVGHYLVKILLADKIQKTFKVIRKP